RLLREDRGGHIVELQDADAIYERPQHPYTRRLLEAIPVGDPAQIRARMAARQKAAEAG
ncbi:MAG: hypothetical protein D6776_05555, partial [Planctomycetota bacterium]